MPVFSCIGLLVYAPGVVEMCPTVLEGCSWVTVVCVCAPLAAMQTSAMQSHLCTDCSHMCALTAEILSDYEAKLTASYSQTYSAGTNAGITVAVPTGSHGTVIRGE